VVQNTSHIADGTVPLIGAFHTSSFPRERSWQPGSQDRAGSSGECGTLGESDGCSPALFPSAPEPLHGLGGVIGDQPARASRLRTVLSRQAPPRAVRMPRLFNALAIALNVVASGACIWRTMGSTLAANASAASRFAATPLACLGQVGPVSQYGGGARRCGHGARGPLAVLGSLLPCGGAGRRLPLMALVP
jgi:hypothetical protein